MAFWNKKSEDTAASKAKRSHRLKIICAVLGIALVGFVGGGVYAKYTYSNIGKSTVRARDFYFTSPQLKRADTAADIPQYTLNADTTELTIELRNYINPAEYADDDIQYTVTIDNGAGISIGGVDTGNGELDGGTNSQQTVTLTGLEAGKTYQVVAEGSAGYEEILKGTFIVKPANAEIYKHLANVGHVYTLTVKTFNTSGDVWIDIPADLAPDNTDPIMALVGTGDDFGHAGFGAYSSHTYRFFGTPGSYNVDSFSVKLGGAEADPMPSPDWVPVP